MGTMFQPRLTNGGAISVKILIVDDEPIILDLAKRILERSGFDTCLAETGSEALRLVKQEPDAFGVAVIDWIMADYSGLETLAFIREIKPTISAVFSSGNILSQNDIPPALRDNTQFLQKPYRTTELVEIVRKLLPTEEKVS